MNCRDQGYDGAASIRSSTSGVQGSSLALSQQVFYTHCQAHQLNLCVVKGCSISLDNASGTISEIAKVFF